MEENKSDKIEMRGKVSQEQIVEALKKEPHVSIQDMAGNTHLIPISVFYKIITGEMKIEQLDDWEKLLPRIIKDWLFFLEQANATRVVGNLEDRIREKRKDK